ncbi:MAG: Uma2 family endonuclease [Verrucomicrobiales bacterium]|nr:Uma2 family endonuclease [Verrucomicrobiales bacterium]
MSEAYEEIVEGETCLRHPPDSRHEAICARLHEHVTLSVATLTSTRLLPPRSVVQLSAGTLLRPDLALVASATGKVWLAAEIVNSHDHRPDTVRKKTLYDEIKLPRLWMIDPRYDTMEVYHGGPYGLTLHQILAQHETLTEALLPGLSLTMAELFGLAAK